ncbi:MAG: flagellar hook protein FlgE [Desulfobacterales bacterium]|nr:flagellar hook protein FlgE [Desulfobacterales bacterium]
MIGSLFAGISGLNANSTAMTVIGDNIANVNTTAFKSNRASFANVLSQAIGGGGNDIGRGVEFWGTTPIWSQGSLENTSAPMDMAINGRGFFMVNDASGSNFFTRAGEFTFDRDGRLVNPDDLQLQGYRVLSENPDGSLNLGTLDAIQIPTESTTPPQASTEFTVDVNLDSGALVGDTYSTTITVFDSLGNDVPLTLDFVKTGSNAWTWQANSTMATAVTPAAPTAIAFDATTGDLLGTTDPTIDLTLSTGATMPTLTWDLYDAATSSTNGDITQYASQSTTTFQTQNGFPAGSLRAVSVNEAGVVTGSYSNGQLVPLFQVALADFPSYYGLTKMGGNLYAASLQSGDAMPGVPGSGRLGSISPSAIEMSNVDLGQEFVKMITTQRAFQANSRVITTSDEILNELINIKR